MKLVLITQLYRESQSTEQKQILHSCVRVHVVLFVLSIYFNLSALELDIYSLAHHLCTM